jgi:hypothetical protein
MNRKLVIPPIGILILVVLALLLTFSSSCGCLKPDEEFKWYIGLRYNDKIDPNAVKAGFEKHFPTGKLFNKENLLNIKEGENIFLTKRDSLICTYYYEQNIIAKRGYRVIIEIDKSYNTKEIKVAKISTWFGKELSKL